MEMLTVKCYKVKKWMAVPANMCLKHSVDSNRRSKTLLLLMHCCNAVKNGFVRRPAPIDDQGAFFKPFLSLKSERI